MLYLATLDFLQECRWRRRGKQRDFFGGRPVEDGAIFRHDTFAQRYLGKNL